MGQIVARARGRPATSAPNGPMAFVFMAPASVHSPSPKGKGAGQMVDARWCDTDAMAAHLIEISAAVDPGAHAVLIVDPARLALDAQAGDGPTTSPSFQALPPRSPELNPVENVLAIHARQLVVEPDLQILRRHRRAVLPSLEQPHRPTMEDHVPRHAQMGAWVLINDRWYYQPVCRSSNE